MPTGEWTPPDAGDAPDEVKAILKSVYSDCRDKNPGEDPAKKERCAKIAWGAVHRAGWVRSGDTWTKQKENASPDTSIDTGSAGTQEQSGTVPHIRALATPFRKTQMIEQDGGLLIKGVKMLAQGNWTDSAVRTPLFYPNATLRRDAANWQDPSGWSRHLSNVPRDITDKVAEAREFRFEDDAVTADVFVHGKTQKSRDTIEMVRHGLISYVSVEHGGTERYNSESRQMEASSLVFYGFAFVNKGACKLCRINEESPKPEKEPTKVDLMPDTKELEAAIAAAMAPVLKELEALKKPPEPLKVEIPKELTESIAALDGTIKELAGRVEKLEKIPEDPKTKGTQDVKELESLPEYLIPVNRKTGIIGAE